MLELSAGEAEALRSAGKRLASSKAFWGATKAENEDLANRSVIRCTPTSHGRYQVAVAEAVGIVATPTLQLIVQPKIPMEHFRYLLRRSSTFPRLDRQPTSAASSAELWDLVATWFIDAFEQLLRRGLLADYSEVRDELQHMRGTIQPVETASAYYQGRLAFSCSYDEFGLNTPLNRLLRAASACLAATPFLAPELRARARRSLARLDGVGPLAPNDLMHAPDRHSAQYSAAVDLARHVLASTGRTVDGGTHRAWTFLLRTPELVEDAVRGVLRDGLKDVCPVTKTGIQLAPSTLTLNPDLVFGSRAVGDVKYTLLDSDWKRSHLYQAVAFATGYSVAQAGVIGFSQEGKQPPDVQVGGVSLKSFVWDSSSSSDPDDSAAHLIASVRAWLSAQLQAVSA